jgi:hypothetical protein
MNRHDNTASRITIGKQAAGTFLEHINYGSHEPPTDANSYLNMWFFLRSKVYGQRGQLDVRLRL